MQQTSTQSQIRLKKGKNGGTRLIFQAKGVMLLCQLDSVRRSSSSDLELQPKKSRQTLC